MDRPHTMPKHEITKQLEPAFLLFLSCFDLYKPRNLRKDKYNRKLKRYFVDIEDDDESIDEDAEILREETEQVGPSIHPSHLWFYFLYPVLHLPLPLSHPISMQAGSNVQLQQVPEKLSRLADLPAEGAESGSDDDDDDDDDKGRNRPTQANGGPQDFWGPRHVRCNSSMQQVI